MLKVTSTQGLASRYFKEFFDAQLSFLNGSTCNLIETVVILHNEVSVWSDVYYYVRLMSIRDSIKHVNEKKMKNLIRPLRVFKP